MNNLTPKQRFLQNAVACSQHNETIHSPTFQYAVDLALLEFQQRLDREFSPTDLNQAARNYMMLRGAKEFLFVFQNLGEKQRELAPPIDTINLETRKS